MKFIADEAILHVKESFGRLGKIKTMPASDIGNKNVKNADVLLVRSVTKINENLLRNTNIKYVGSATSGIDHVDIKYLRKHRIGFAYAAGSNARAVAEYVTACLSAICRSKGLILPGMTVGIIGAGHVGSSLAKICDILGMKIMLNDPPLARTTKAKKYLPLEALSDADIISLHVPMTYSGRDKTYHLADDRFFKNLKDGVIFMNTSRGPVVDENALLKHIRRDKFTATVLDVWPNEPSISTELLQRVDIGTPHIAGYSLEAKLKATTMLYKAASMLVRQSDPWSPMKILNTYAKARVKVDGLNKTAQDMAYEIIFKLYLPLHDDEQLRKIVDLPRKKQGEYFESLRKNYRIRHEFSNTELLISNGPRKVTALLEKLGFCIVS